MRNTPPRRERAVLVGTKEEHLLPDPAIDFPADVGCLWELAGLVETYAK